MNDKRPSIVRTVVIAVLAFVLVTFAVAAFAQQQPQCGPAVEMEHKLRDQYKETPRWVGRTPDNSALLVVAASPDGATWTIYVRRQDGVVCFLVAGVKGEFVDGPKKGEPS